MTKLNLYLRPVRHRPWWTYLASLALIALAVWATNYAYRTSKATEQMLASLEKQQRKRSAATPITLTRTQLEQKKLWEQLAIERDFDWSGLFQTLQNNNHAGIELLEFRPEKRQAIIVLRGEAKSVADLSDYLKKMSAQPIFSRIYLTKQDLRAHGQLETVGFEIRGQLKN